MVFYVLFACFDLFLRERKIRKLDESGGREDIGGLGGNKSIIKIYEILSEQKIFFLKKNNFISLYILIVFMSLLWKRHL